MFTLAISCLTTSNLPWFMDLTFQVPMQYYSLQHWTLLLSPVTSTTGCCFCFGSVSSFFLEIFLHQSPAAYWAPTDLGSSPFSVLYFCLFILIMGFSRQEYWDGLPFHSPVNHILSELSTMTHPSWGIKSILAISRMEWCCLQGGIVLVLGVSKWLKNKLIRDNRPDFHKSGVEIWSTNMFVTLGEEWQGFGPKWPAGLTPKVANIIPGSPVVLEMMTPTDGLLAGIICLPPTLEWSLRDAVVEHTVGNTGDEGLTI